MLAMKLLEDGRHPMRSKSRQPNARAMWLMSDWTQSSKRTLEGLQYTMFGPLQMSLAILLDPG